ncbi:FAD-dependent monooxygenase [Hymenobacter rubripertinctus]|nr:FAD-dependent monooxygenase [Hymenobacter rubripertinctus]
MKIAIVGGGIGGLTTAIALHRKGISATVFETSAELKPVGAGIILANNATQVLQRLGLLAALRNAGHPISELRITDAQLHPISRSDLAYFERLNGAGSLAIHRAELQRILLEHLPAGQFRLNKRVERVEVVPGQGADLQFGDGTRERYDAVIGADGIHSVVRNAVTTESTIRKAGQICWRGIAAYRLPAAAQHCLQEAWGTGLRFGFTHISATHVYWYALATGLDLTPQSPAQLQQLFRDFAPLVGQILSHTSAAQIMTHEILDFKPLSTWEQGAVCLIGDAAHATTPNLGQGACQAIVDAYTLAELFTSGTEVAPIFRRFYETRHAKTALVTTTSWNVGKLAHLQNPMACRLRNTLMRLTPAFISRKQNEKLFALELDSLT